MIDVHDRDQPYLRFLANFKHISLPCLYKISLEDFVVQVLIIYENAAQIVVLS